MQEPNLFQDRFNLKVGGKMLNIAKTRFAAAMSLNKLFLLPVYRKLSLKMSSHLKM